MSYVYEICEIHRIEQVQKDFLFYVAKLYTLAFPCSVTIDIFLQLFEQREAAAKENEILGESGIKKAVAAKKTNNDQETAAST